LLGICGLNQDFLQILRTHRLLSILATYFRRSLFSKRHVCYPIAAGGKHLVNQVSVVYTGSIRMRRLLVQLVRNNYPTSNLKTQTSNLKTQNRPPNWSETAALGTRRKSGFRAIRPLGVIPQTPFWGTRASPRPPPKGLIMGGEKRFALLGMIGS